MIEEQEVRKQAQEIERLIREKNCQSSKQALRTAVEEALYEAAPDVHEIQFAEDVQKERPVSFVPLISLPREFSFQLPGKQETETLEKARSQDQLRITQQQTLEGCVEISADLITPQRFRLRVRVKNVTEAGKRTRDEVLLHSFISTHTILNIQKGEFLSLLDPPEDLGEIAAASEN